MDTKVIHSLREPRALLFGAEGMRTVELFARNQEAHCLDFACYNYIKLFRIHCNCLHIISSNVSLHLLTAS